MGARQDPAPQVAVELPRSLVQGHGLARPDAELVDDITPGVVSLWRALFHRRIKMWEARTLYSQGQGSRVWVGGEPGM